MTSYLHISITPSGRSHNSRGHTCVCRSCQRV